jgi:hypothetical protein
MKDATQAPNAAPDHAAPAVTHAAAANPIVDADAEWSSSLPRDHPAWQRDVLSVSARARAVLARLRPIAVRVLTFWDHAVRRAFAGGRRIEVDPSGCYRVR